MKVRALRVLGVMVAAVALMLGITTSAQASATAADGPELCTAGGHSCSWFKNNGDVIYTADTLADGYSAVTQVCAPGDDCRYVATYVWNNGGAGTTAWISFGDDVPEGINVYYRPCYGRSSDHVIISCNSGWTHGQA